MLFPVRVGARRVVLLLSTAGVVYILDRLTKIWVESRLQGREPVVLIPNVLQLRYVENPGGAFSLFGGQPWLFFAASLVVVAAIVIMATRPISWSSALGLGLVLGGALGNLTDRVTRGAGVSGKVVDWIEFPRVWPVFNVADSCIVTGALVLVLYGAFHRGVEPEDTARAPAGGSGAGRA